MRQEQVIELAVKTDPDFLDDDMTHCLLSLEAVTRFAFLVEQATLERAASIVENADTPDCGGWAACGIAEDIRNLSSEPPCEQPS